MGTLERRVNASIAKAPDLARPIMEETRQAVHKPSETFERFSDSHRREYVEWVTAAKRETTRRQRITTAMEWMAEGKPRNWKYMKAWRR